MPPKHRAGQAAQAADRRGDERLDADEKSHVERRKKQRPEQYAGGSRHDTGHQERIGRGSFHAYAHELGRFRILRGGLHRDAKPRVTEEQLQQRHHRRTRARRSK